MLLSRALGELVLDSNSESAGEVKRLMCLYQAAWIDVSEAG